MAVARLGCAVPPPQPDIGPLVSNIFIYPYNKRDLLRLTFLASRRWRRIVPIFSMRMVLEGGVAAWPMD